MSFGDVLTAVDAVNRAIAIYKKVDAVPEQMSKLHKGLQRLSTTLAMLEDLFKRKSTYVLGALRAAQRQDLKDIINDIKSDANEVRDLFERWNNDTAPFGLQFKFKAATNAYFALGSGMERVQALTDSLEAHKQELRDYLQIMGAQDLKDILAAQAQAAAVANPAMLQAATGPLTPLAAPPSPKPPKKDHRIIFVDPQNLGRSVVAMACMHLLKEWTQRTGGDWRTTYAHSAGFFIKRSSDVIDVLESMPYSHKSYKLAFRAGGEAPSRLALDAVFDNSLYNFPFKKDVKEAAEKHRSRGIKRDIFKAYDFIIVFTGREHDNMVQLRRTLREKDGAQLTPKGKGRVLHLGSYIKQPSGGAKEIVDVKWANGKQTREDWNAKVSEIKLALKAFLKQELQWSQPPKGAVVVN
jgi:protein-tyrosine-phosphatase